jgi:hypothetical protein
VKEGDQIIPLINRLATGFGTWCSRRTHAGTRLLRVVPSGQEAVRDNPAAVRHAGPVADHCVQGTPGADLHRTSGSRTPS